MPADSADLRTDQVSACTLWTAVAAPDRRVAQHLDVVQAQNAQGSEIENPGICTLTCSGQTKAMVDKDIRSFKAGLIANSPGDLDRFPIFPGSFVLVRLPHGREIQLLQVNKLLQRGMYTSKSLTFSGTLFKHTPQRAVPGLYGTFEPVEGATGGGKRKKRARKFEILTAGRESVVLYHVHPDKAEGKKGHYKLSLTTLERLHEQDGSQPFHQPPPLSHRPRSDGRRPGRRGRSGDSEEEDDDDDEESDEEGGEEEEDDEWEGESEEDGQEDDGDDEDDEEDDEEDVEDEEDEEGEEKEGEEVFDPYDDMIPGGDDLPDQEDDVPNEKSDSLSGEPRVDRQWPPPMRPIDGARLTGWDFVSKGGCEFVFVNTDEDDLPEDKRARFPVALGRMVSTDSENETVSFDWCARGHVINKTTSEFEPGKTSYRYIECYQGNRADDVPWHQVSWPARWLIPVTVEIVNKQKGAVWVSPASMAAMKAHCESFGPDRKGRKRKSSGKRPKQ